MQNTDATTITATTANTSPGTLPALRAQLRSAKHEPEATAIRRCLEAQALDAAARQSVRQKAIRLVEASRKLGQHQGVLDSFLHEFGLSTREGVTLMCLAEAFLRIPDEATRNAFIAEKLGGSAWGAHAGKSERLFVNAGIWALMLTGRLLDVEPAARQDAGGWLQGLTRRLSAPLLRSAVDTAMRIMGSQFVYAQSIEEALCTRAGADAQDRLFSFDMLGEGARTADAAQRYRALYLRAIEAVGQASATDPAQPELKSSVSIKLSALFPRYEFAQSARVRAELLPVLRELALAARRYNIQLTIDAEEADRLDLSMDLIESLARDPALAGWDGLGLALQAYQKRALYLIDWLGELARQTQRVIAVRLVKGAYWDSEIKHAQVQGYADYPVYTRKAATDVSYIACAARLFRHAGRLYPQFATHNAYTLAAVHAVGEGHRYEYQRLHGMGDILYRAARQTLLSPQARVRTYAPVGSHEDLLPYLVRRLLENGANSSFVNRFLNAHVEPAEVVPDPVEQLEQLSGARPPIPLPAQLFGSARANSRGLDLSEPAVTGPLLERLAMRASQPREGACIVNGQRCGGLALELQAPADRRQRIGSVTEARAEDIEAAVHHAAAAQPAWNAQGGVARGAILRRLADRIESEIEPLLDLLAREAGRTLADGIAEVREAADFCRYYAEQAEREFEGLQRLPGPTGERNELQLCGRGVFLCISPWNFPLAIFAGQVAAALAAGNTVIAKPAEQTPMVAVLAVDLFHAAGVPAEALQLLLGDGPRVAGPLLGDERVAGVCFTGSIETARLINRALAARDGAIPVLIAETGGLNAMVVDSTALLEQVTDDVLVSAFASAGQRCSALRLLLVQDDVADPLLDMIRGALRERRLGDPACLSTDIGPIIDADARAELERHAGEMDRVARLVAGEVLAPGLAEGTFFVPRVYEIDSLSRLTREVFGPILHVLRYRNEDLPRLVAELEAKGYGLTFGVHSRLDSRVAQLFAASSAGNVYVNRSIIGAVVGVQPFGGSRLSGTGPKAGGPHYLHRFATERTLTVNTTAVGGNAEILQLGG